MKRFSYISYDKGIAILIRHNSCKYLLNSHFRIAQFKICHPSYQSMFKKTI